jgi:hypothetical protein
MSRDDFWVLFLGCMLFLVGLVAFFGRSSVAEFLGAKIIFGDPADASAFWKVRFVGWVGVFLSGLGLVVMCGAAWRNPPKDGKKE